MAGTIAGGKEAAKTNKEKYGTDYYKRIGAIGGKKGKTGGFAYPSVCFCNDIQPPHWKRQCAGKKGGRISKRTKRTV